MTNFENPQTVEAVAIPETEQRVMATLSEAFGRGKKSVVKDVGDFFSSVKARAQEIATRTKKLDFAHKMVLAATAASAGGAGMSYAQMMRQTDAALNEQQRSMTQTLTAEEMLDLTGNPYTNKKTEQAQGAATATAPNRALPYQIINADAALAPTEDIALDLEAPEPPNRVQSTEDLLPVPPMRRGNSSVVEKKPPIPIITTPERNTPIDNLETPVEWKGIEVVEGDDISSLIAKHVFGLGSPDELAFDIYTTNNKGETVFSDEMNAVGWDVFATNIHYKMVNPNEDIGFDQDYLQRAIDTASREGREAMSTNLQNILTAVQNGDFSSVLKVGENMRADGSLKDLTLYMDRHLNVTKHEGLGTYLVMPLLHSDAQKRVYLANLDNFGASLVRSESGEVVTPFKNTQTGTITTYISVPQPVVQIPDVERNLTGSQKTEWSSPKRGDALRDSGRITGLVDLPEQLE